MKKIHILFLCLLFLGACKDRLIEIKEPTLPLETQTGARTFGCFVDGKLYVPKGGSSPGRHAISTNIQFDILNLKTDNGSDGINISTSGLNGTGDYSIASNNGFANYIIGSNNYESTVGTLTITKYDKISRIISGRFFFSAKDPKTGKTVNVTEGRFDVTFTN